MRKVHEAPKPPDNMTRKQAKAAVADIKDRTPNKATIEQIESMLEDAKAGKIRTIIAISGWDDDSWTHMWSMDSRTSRLRMIGKISEMQHEVLTNNALGDEDSILFNALD